MKIVLSIIVVLVALLASQNLLFRKTYKVHNDGAVIITGASTGIGYHTAILFAKKGYLVLASVRRDDDVNKLNQLGYKNIVPFKVEFTDESQIVIAVKEISEVLKKHKKPLVFLLNNAAISHSFPVEFLPIDEARYMFDVNFFSVISFTQKLLPEIRKSQGRIINVGSLLGEVTLPFSGMYCATKFALRAYTDALRRELSPWNIYVGNFQPSYVNSSIANRSLDYTLNYLKKVPETLNYYSERYEDEIMKKK